MDIPAILFAAACALTNASDVTLAVHKSAIGATFDLRGTAFPCVPDHTCFLLTDASGSVRVDCENNADSQGLKCGDTVRAAGRIAPDPSGIGVAFCSNLAVEAHGEPPPVADASLDDIKKGRYDFLPVKVRGTIKEVFRDDIDPTWYYLVLTDGGRSIYMTMPSECADFETVRKTTGAFVSVSGLCSPWDYGYRVTLGRLITLLDARDIEVIRSAPSDPFDVPEIATIRFPNPEDIPPLERRRLSGRVIAVWRGNRILVKDGNGGVHTVEISGGAMPEYGAAIEAAGLLKTDLYRMNLSDAIWRRAGPPAADGDPVEDVRGIMTDEKGSPRIIPTLHGRTFRIRGTVQDRPSSDWQYALVTLKCGDETVPVDMDANRQALDGIDIGCVIEATGTCIVECDNWHSYSTFPHITDVTLVVRRPSDVRMVSHPPWWTAKRLTGVIGALLAALLCVVVRSRMQKRTAARLAKLATDLKVEERTRLAVELHDSLAQDLTGVAFEIDTAGKLAGRDNAAMRNHLGHAANALKSCRDELRNCLWDLRSSTLEATSMDEAIRHTLAPHAAGAELAVRFNVPRERLSDNMAHAVLRIVRELTVNAVRHGRATKVWIAGSVDNGRMMFSVRDNGCGFDPASAPGFAEGHYGLTGISERVETFEGDFSLESAPGKGAKATITLNL